MPKLTKRANRYGQTDGRTDLTFAFRKLYCLILFCRKLSLFSGVKMQKNIPRQLLAMLEPDCLCISTIHLRGILCFLTRK